MAAGWVPCLSLEHNSLMAWKHRGRSLQSCTWTAPLVLGMMKPLKAAWRWGVKQLSEDSEPVTEGKEGEEHWQPKANSHMMALQSGT